MGPAGSDFVGTAEHGEGKVKQGCCDQVPAPDPVPSGGEVESDQGYCKQEERAEYAFGISSLAVVSYRHR